MFSYKSLAIFSNKSSYISIFHYLVNVLNIEMMSQILKRCPIRWNGVLNVEIVSGTLKHCLKPWNGVQNLETVSRTLKQCPER